jgi:phosphatidylglycerol:prolipoprotein diacylglycerol transferase
MATSIIIAAAFALYRAARRGMDGDEPSDCILWAVVGALIGARLYYVIFYGNWNELLAVWHGGLAIYGAIIGGAVSIWIFCKKKNTKFWRIADLFAPCLLLGQATGRWGNFVNAEAYGGNYNGIFAMTINGVSVHPTFVYESVWCALGLVLILVAEGLPISRPRADNILPYKDGMIFAIYVAWYGLGRMFIEGIRADSLMMGSLRISQILAVISFLISIWFIYRLTKKGKS